MLPAPLHLSLLLHISLIPAISPLDLDHLLQGSPHLDELYGSGDFKYNPNDVDSHYAYSVESLERLFKIEKRFVEGLRSLSLAIKRKTESWNLPISVDLESPQVKDEEFLTGPPVGLYRIQSLHNISILSLSQGRLSLSLPSSPHTLSWQDTLLVSHKARDKNDLVKTVEWLQVTVKLCKENEAEDCDTVEEMLREAIGTHDSIALSHGKFVINKTFPTVTRIIPFNRTLANRHRRKVRTWERKFAEFVERFPMYEESREAPADIFFADNVAHSEKISSQCQDLTSSPFISRLSSLQCHLLTRHTPHLRLGPLKLETLSLSPGVAALHDLLTPGQCQEMRARGRDRMKVTPFTLGEAGLQRNTFSDRRMSKIRYISHRRDPLASKINKKLSDALELDLDGSPIPAEHYQLMNYGLGGYIELHLDSNLERGGEVEYGEARRWVVGGERLMTVMIYLSSLQGGRTVFPLLGLSSTPSPGTALVWHTVDTSGRPQQRMKHLGCPVVFGDKWILNKWVKWHHHMFSYPCYRDRQFYSFVK